jgi:TRAP-type C4-dicarboxylate transport system permease small subunit
VATAAAIFGYLCVLAHYAWRVVGWQKYYATPELRIPRAEEAVYVLAMLVCGLLAGQAVRQARRLAAGYSVTVEAGPAAEAATETPGAAAAPTRAEGT